MAERATPLAATIEELERARGDDRDGVWAFSTSLALLERDVAADLVTEGLREALVVVREAQEPPEVLFGTPREHADDLYDRWLAEGRLVLDDGVTSWRDSIVIGLGLSAVCAVVAAVLLLVRDETGWATVVRVVGVSVVVGLGSALGQALWSRRHRRPDPGPQVPSDVRWAMELTEILRSRRAMSGPRARDVVVEARSHAAESGRTLEEEFGTPETYAARLTPDHARRNLYTAALLSVLALVNVVLLVDGPHVSNVALMLGFGWLAVVEWRRHRTARAR